MARLHPCLILLFLPQDSPTNKLLYAKEIPEYRKIVQRYYKQIHDMTPLSEQEMNAHLAEESRVRPALRGPCLVGDGEDQWWQRGAVSKEQPWLGWPGADRGVNPLPSSCLVFSS